MAKRILLKVNSPEYFEYLAERFDERARTAAQYNVPDFVCQDMKTMAATLTRCARLLREATKKGNK